MSDYYDPDYDELHPIFLGEGEVGESVRCARCGSSWDVGETYQVDDQAVCPECVQEAIDALVDERDRLRAERGARLDD